MEIADRSGQPVTTRELNDAINAVESILLRQPTVLPLFTVNGMAIRRALLELRQQRSLRWLNEWPTEPGQYWFYGKRFRSSKHELCLVEVNKISNGVCYTTHGHFLYKAEGCEGKWQKVILPELPVD